MRIMRMTKAMPTFEIWSEGHSATGESAPAHFMGTGYGNTFAAACKWKLGSSRHFKEGDPPTYWGCRLFDNEVDARKTFG